MATPASGDYSFLVRFFRTLDLESASRSRPFANRLSNRLALPLPNPPRNHPSFGAPPAIKSSSLTSCHVSRLASNRRTSVDVGAWLGPPSSSSSHRTSPTCRRRAEGVGFGFSLRGCRFGFNLGFDFGFDTKGIGHLTVLCL